MEFTSYENPVNPRKVNINIFYVMDATTSALYWCHAGTHRVQTPDLCLPLASITDVYFGKQLFDDIAADSVDNQCISVVGQNSSLHLEAPTIDQALNFVETLQLLARSVSMKSKKDDNRISFAMKQDTDKKKRKQTLLDSSCQDAVRMMQNGVKFTSFIEHNGEVQKELVDVFYSPSDDPTETGSIYWTPNQEAKMTIPISELDMILTGRQTRIFSLPGTEGAEEDRCVGLISKRKTLYLEALRDDVASHWVFGLNSIIESSGRKVCVEDVSRGRRQYRILDDVFEMM